MTPFMPHTFVHKILHDESAKLRKYHCYSVWYYDENRKEIIICTTRPGLWIGRNGANTEKIQSDVNKILNEHNIDEIKISYIECQS